MQHSVHTSPILLCLCMSGYILLASLCWSLPSVAARNETSDPKPAPRSTPPLAPLFSIPRPSTSPEKAKELRKVDEPALAPKEWSIVVRQLRAKNLVLPVSGVAAKSLKGSFYQRRGAGLHHAADIIAPRNTPVVAMDDGSIGKLWTSEAGGITVYQFDKSGQFVYYYAHLERYAPNLHEGDTVQKGQVIGYIGTSGDAPEDTPHLHFAIYKATEKGRWWRGAPVDPWEVFAADSSVVPSSPYSPGNSSAVSPPNRTSPPGFKQGVQISPYFWI